MSRHSQSNLRLSTALCCLLAAGLTVFCGDGTQDDSNLLQAIHILDHEHASVEIVGISTAVEFYAPLSVAAFDGYLRARGADYEIKLRRGRAVAEILALLQNLRGHSSKELRGSVRWRVSVLDGDSQFVIHVSDQGELIEDARILIPTDDQWWHKVAKGIQRDLQ